LVSATENRLWRRLFVPSIADLFFIAAIIWLFVAGVYGWQTLLQDGDVGTHIRIGDYIWANHTVPTRDFLSFSKPGEEWYAFEWLTEVLFSFLYGAAGLKGVVLLSGVVISLAFTVVLLHAIWRGSNVLAALVLTLMAVNASSIHFHARPHIFTMLFAALAMWMIDIDRRRESWLIWMLAPLTVLWTNLHGGFLILFATLALLAAGSFAESLLWGEQSRRGKSAALRYSLVGVSCAAASLVNPYGVKLHLFIREYLNASAIRNGVQEFQSPSFRSESMFHYMILLFVGLALTGALLKKHRLVEVLWIWFWAYNSLVSVRHAPLFMIVAVPIVAAEFTDWWQRAIAMQPPRSIARTLDAITAQFQAGSLRMSLWAPCAVLILCLSHMQRWPENFLEGSFPVKIVNHHASEIASARVFTSDKWAGYLIFHNYPRQRVFFDDRHAYYGDAMIQDYLTMQSGGPEWRKLLDRYDLNMALCSSDGPLAALLKLDADWTPVESDDKITLFARRSPMTRAALDPPSKN
jgi:hypothetical protein